jgi:hypothetical protein
MKRPVLLVLFLAATAFAASGCATSKVAGHERTSVLGGLVEITKNDYTPPPATTVPVDNSVLGRTDKPSGTKTSLLWGLITYTNY